MRTRCPAFDRADARHGSSSVTEPPGTYRLPTIEVPPEPRGRQQARRAPPARATGRSPSRRAGRTPRPAPIRKPSRYALAEPRLRRALEQPAPAARSAATPRTRSPVPSGDESSTTSTSTRSGRASRRASTHSIVSRSSYVGRITRVRRRSGESGAGARPRSRSASGASRPSPTHEDEREPRHPVPQADVRASGRSDERIVVSEDRRLEQTRLRHDPSARVDERADARDGGVHDPPAVLDRADPAHLQVLRGRGRGPVRRVVHGHDQERRPRRRTNARVERGEAVLEADRRAERRDALDLQTRGPAPPAPGRPGSARIASRSTTARRATARTHRTAPGAPCRSDRPGSRSRRSSTTLVRWRAVGIVVEHGSDQRRRAHLGDRVADRRHGRGSLAAPGSSAPSPQTARSGGSAASSGCSRGVHPGDADRPPRPMSSCAARRTSTCNVAMSIVAAVRDAGTGSRAARRPGPRPSGQAAGAPAPSPAADRPPPRGARSPPATTNVTPHTPAIVARRRVTRLSTWETPSDAPAEPPERPDVRGPSRRRSTAPPARPPMRTGRPRRCTAGASSPNRAADAGARGA